MPIIKLENLSKKYKIVHEREGAKYSTLRDEMVSAVKKPFLWLAGRGSARENVWVLKNINLEIEPGEVLGIIGPNGAGKTTLLKILAKITPPSEGKAVIGGRVGSLLEVGTGFHPELTGRENIYLNGAILGMSKEEIKNKFEEIIEFAGVKKFLDTPVKRFSDGMRVRLAFSVAAHLEPEILLVDEVLSVGDIEFQKKCLGKMSEVTQKSGRTILFVSHNMGQIRKLCQRVILLNNGVIEKEGNPKTVVDDYIASKISLTFKENVENENVQESESVALKSFSVFGKEKGFPPRTGDPLNMEMTFKFKEPLNNPGVRVFINTLQGINVMYFTSTPFGGLSLERGEGTIKFNLNIEELTLTGGQYILSVGMFRPALADYLKPVQVGQFEVQPADYYGVGIDLLNPRAGIVAAKHNWSFEKLN